MTILLAQICLGMGTAYSNPGTQTYPVSRISFVYGDGAEDLPSLDMLGRASLTLGERGNTVQLSDLFRGASHILNLSHRDLFRVSEVPLQFLKSQGYEGMVVFPDPGDIDPVSGQDLRIPGDTSMRFVIWVSRLESVKLETDGLKEMERRGIEKKLEQYVVEQSPYGKPVRKDLYQFMNQLGGHSSRDARVLLSAKGGPGRVEAILKATRRDTPNLSFSAANAGSDSTGKWLFSGVVQTDQLTGLDDRLSVSSTLSNTGERRGVLGSYYIPLIRPEVLTLGVGLGYSSYDASTFAVTTIDFEGESLFFDLSLGMDPLFLRGDKISAGIEVGMKLENVSAFNSIINRSGGATFFTPRLGVKIEHRGDYWQGQTSLSLKGNVSGISVEDQRALGGVQTIGRYSRVSFQHFEVFRLGKLIGSASGGRAGDYLARHFLNLRFQADWALRSGRHLPQHQFITGGTGSVRGYPESPAAGDSGYLFSVEYHFPFFVMDGGQEGKLAWSFIPFLDWASTQVNDPYFFESDQTLLGAGLGVEFQLPFGLYARIDFAKPLSELTSAGTVLDGTRSGDYRVHGLFRWKF